MSAIPLFDALAAWQDSSSPSERHASGTIAQLAEKMIAASLNEVRQIRDYEEQFVFDTERDPRADLALRRSVWDMFSAWANDAERILARAKNAAGVGSQVRGAEELRDEIGRVHARLTITPEQIQKAREQAKQGQVVPAKELRDELHARLCR